MYTLYLQLQHVLLGISYTLADSARIWGGGGGAQGDGAFLLFFFFFCTSLLFFFYLDGGRHKLTPETIFIGFKLLSVIYTH